MPRVLDIRQKEVINVLNGKRMGTIIDMQFGNDGRLESITVPGPMRVTDFFRGDRRGILIPWENIQKVGEDVILVSIDPSGIHQRQSWER